MKDFREILESDGVYVFDGAMGTRLYDKGIYINRSYDELNLVAPDPRVLPPRATGRDARTVGTRPPRAA